jgi:hypothetical protein
MKRFALLFAVMAVVGLLAMPVFAESRGPASERLIETAYAKTGQAVPQITYNYLIDFLTNAYGIGFSSVLALTNYSDLVRNHIIGYVVPKGANPGEELDVDVWLNPYEVAYIDLSRLGLGDENGWAFLTSPMNDFGCGVFIYNSTPNLSGMTWIKPWYWTTN